jgi:hypothetical protein
MTHGARNVRHGKHSKHYYAAQANVSTFTGPVYFSEIEMLPLNGRSRDEVPARIW